MKGIIFNLVEEAVVADHGEDAWDAVLGEAGLGGAYTSLGMYPDSELDALVAAGARLLACDPQDLTRRIGRHAIAGLADRYPRFFTPHRTTRGFLLTLNDVIHPEVRKIHAQADPPTFGFDDGPDGALVLRYDSRRRLCALAGGMIEGAALHYGEHATVREDSCMREGAPSCTFVCSFTVVPAHA